MPRPENFFSQKSLLKFYLFKIHRRLSQMSKKSIHLKILIERAHPLDGFV